jgi:hypothetical protein
MRWQHEQQCIGRYAQCEQRRRGDGRSGVVADWLDFAVHS